MAGLVGTKLPCQVQASHGNVIADTAIVLHRQEIDRTGNAENPWKIPSMIFHVIGIRTGISIQPDAFGLE